MDTAKSKKHRKPRNYGLLFQIPKMQNVTLDMTGHSEANVIII
jgi:hypothetical protein